jgi:hypothetical protein
MEHDGLAVIELRTMRSAWQALTRRWELTSDERSALLPSGGEEDASPSRDTETRMRILIEIGYRIELPCDLLHDWLRTATPTLDWLTPLDAMSGPMADLRGFRRLVEMGFAS